MVSLLIITTEIDCIVRFQREVWSEHLGRNFVDTDLIIIIDPALEQDLRNDFVLYQKLDDDAQRKMIGELRTGRYAGRMLPDVALPAYPPAVTASTENGDAQQFSLF